MQVGFQVSHQTCNMNMSYVVASLSIPQLRLTDVVLCMRASVQLCRDFNFNKSGSQILAQTCCSTSLISRKGAGHISISSVCAESAVVILDRQSAFICYQLLHSN